MTKGETTRENVIARAAQVFSRQGYAGAAISDIMRETGLEKGGIYNHFRNKDELALEAFDYSANLLWTRLEKSVEDRGRVGAGASAVDRLLAVLDTFDGLIGDPLFPAGCPVLNTAVDSDDTHPALRARVQAVLQRWSGFIQGAVAEGVQRHAIKTDTDAAALATLVLASLEGAVMLCKVQHSRIPMQQMVAHLTWYIRTFVEV